MGERVLFAPDANLFEIDPKMSYPPDAFVKADPDFWKPKAGMAESKKPVAKAAEKPAGQ